MVLDHVAERPGRLVVPPAVLDADGLRDRDLDVVDVAGVPDRLEEGVREPEGEEVLDRLLAEVVVDPVDLPLVGRLEEDLVEGPGARDVAPERLLDDEPVALDVGEEAGRGEPSGAVSSRWAASRSYVSGWVASPWT